MTGSHQINLSDDIELTGVTVKRIGNTIAIGGWYDGNCKIQEHNLSLRDLLTSLDITLDDCKRALE